MHVDWATPVGAEQKGPGWDRAGGGTVSWEVLPNPALPFWRAGPPVPSIPPARHL